MFKLIEKKGVTVEKKVFANSGGLLYEVASRKKLEVRVLNLSV